MVDDEGAVGGTATNVRRAIDRPIHGLPKIAGPEKRPRPIRIERVERVIVGCYIKDISNPYAGNVHVVERERLSVREPVDVVVPELPKIVVLDGIGIEVRVREDTRPAIARRIHG